MEISRLNVAVLSHNALDYTRLCLSSLAANTNAPHRIYVLDNGSTDGSAEWLKSRETRGVSVRLSRSNLGVPAGRNLLIYEILRSTDGGFLVFLDNDVEVSARWYEPFLELFAFRPEVGIAGQTGHRIIVHEKSRELLQSPEGEPEPVDVVSGFCFWVRAETVHAVGLFDESLGPFWHEDDDYCIRALKLGYEVYAVPGAPVTHHAHKSGAAAGFNAEDASISNQQYLAAKWRNLGCVGEDGQIIHGGR